MGFGVMSRSKRGTLAQGPARSVRARDGSRRARGRAPRRRDRRPGPAVRGRRPRRVRRQRRRPAAPRGRHAGAARVEVRARARAARARAGRGPARASSPSRCPRRCGSPGTATTTSSSPTRPPTARALRELAGGPARERVTVMVDCAEHLDLIRRPARRRRRRCGSASTSTRAGGRSAGGCGSAPSARRCARPPQAAALAREIAARPELVLDGLMSYEAHIAGRRRPAAGPPGALRARRSRLCSAPRRASWRARRAAVVAAVRAVAPLRFVNGGGTGSVERTAAEPAVTEVAAGSGPLRPDAVRRLPASRRARRRSSRCRSCAGPSAGVATVLGGGYLASGARGRDRLPRPCSRPACGSTARRAPARCRRRCSGRPPRGLRIGDRVWFRHAKAGELCERFDVVHLVARARARRHGADLPRRGLRASCEPRTRGLRRAHAFSKRPSGSSSRAGGGERRPSAGSAVAARAARQERALAPVRAPAPAAPSASRPRGTAPRRPCPRTRARRRRPCRARARARAARRRRPTKRSSTGKLTGWRSRISRAPRTRVGGVLARDRVLHLLEAHEPRAGEHAERLRPRARGREAAAAGEAG